MLSQASFANAKMMEDNRSMHEDRLDMKRGGGGGVKCEDSFATLYSLHSSDAALSAAVGGPGLSRTLSDHSGKSNSFHSHVICACCMCVSQGKSQLLFEHMFPLPN